MPLQSDKALVSQIYFKKASIQLKDNIFLNFKFQENDYFYQVSKSENIYSDIEFGPGKGIYLYQLFKLDNEFDIYER